MLALSCIDNNQWSFDFSEFNSVEWIKNIFKLHSLQTKTKHYESINIHNKKPAKHNYMKNINKKYL